MKIKYKDKDKDKEGRTGRGTSVSPVYRPSKYMRDNSSVPASSRWSCFFFFSSFSADT